MSTDALSIADILGHGFYPERREKREPLLDRWLRRPVLWFERGIGKGSARFERLVNDVNAVQPDYDAMELPALRAAAQALRPDLKRDGFTPHNIARAFALIRTVAGLTVGKRHYDVQLAGGWVLLHGRVAEMETGEGKTLTATLAAGTAALAGIPVHVVTVNDYLASRDAEEMRPVYEALGLTVGIVTHEVKPDDRGVQYRKDITYATNKDVTFDYLRDRMKLKGRPRPLRYALNKVTGGAEAELTLRGLHFAIVDEVDSVLVDEARTPLILSAERSDGGLERLYREALELARQLVEGDDFVIERHDTSIRITDDGKKRLEHLAKGKRGVWTGPNRREQLIRQALTGLLLFTRDKHYVVSDEKKVQIVDEYTGRIMADRSWEAGLHQMIEVKEGCPLTGQRETIARISYQRFFRRYLRLSGMTGTAAEIKGELWNVYRLKVTRVPTRKDVVRKYAPIEIHATQDEKWDAIVRAVQREVAAGRPVLVGTRSVIASETLSAKLAEAGVEHRLLNARQDKEEADIVAQGGQARRVTVATNMAGRGTDIKPTPDALAAGGLHVICTELHESGRVDRQLWGRCARQGDPGSVETIVSYEDELITRYASFARPIAGKANPLEKTTGPALFRMAQKRAEAVHGLMRKEVLEMDDYLGDLLAFSGRPE